MNEHGRLEVRELKPGFGVEVLNFDVRNADAEDQKELVHLFDRHGALLLRDQDLKDPDDMMAFAEIFGEPEDHTQAQFTLPDYPKIYLLSNRNEKKHPTGAHYSGVGWHTDYSFKEKPVKQTMVYGLEVPPEGGDTLFADLCAAYNALPEKRKQELGELVLHHSYKHFMATREHIRKPLSKQEELENPDVFHPLIRTHPANGRKALWVSTGTVKEIVGMPNPQGLELIGELVDFATQEEFVLRHKWRVGDVITWDNRCTLHTGSLFDDSKYHRHAYRLWIKGDRPY